MSEVALAALRVNQNLRSLKETYEREIDSFNGLKTTSLKKKRAALEGLHNKAVAYFNAYEDSILSDSILGLDKNKLHYNDRAKDIANLLDVVIFYYKQMKWLAVEAGASYTDFIPSDNAFEKMQRLVKDTNPEKANDLRPLFVELSLPTTGFDSPELSMPEPNLKENSKSDSPSLENGQVHVKFEGATISGSPVFNIALENSKIRNSTSTGSPDKKDPGFWTKVGSGVKWFLGVLPLVGSLLKSWGWI